MTVERLKSSRKIPETGIEEKGRKREKTEYSWQCSVVYKPILCANMRMCVIKEVVCLLTETVRKGMKSEKREKGERNKEQKALAVSQLQNRHTCMFVLLSLFNHTVHSTQILSHNNYNVKNWTK